MFHGLLKHALLVALTLASHVDAGRVLIGYRVVDEREAAIINRKKRIFREQRYDEWAEFRGGAQTGLGVYLSGRLDAWHSSPYDCMAQNNALDFYAECFETVEEVRQHHSSPVNYDSWTKQRGLKAGRRMLHLFLVPESVLMPRRNPT
ncbi:hypothetical protein LZ32DRAFT_644858 [Colletotrichum eremochloae]|nr:hypothetical protein LZ32DRAFT_644858 [Colletotrichum eremochloae]